MPYRGLPSRGCYLCRAKKRKCNHAKPECGQCIRAGQQCRGYRDPVDVVIHDQTALVLQKNHAMSIDLKQDYSTLPSYSPSAKGDPGITTLPFISSYAVQNVAVNYFFCLSTPNKSSFASANSSYLQNVYFQSQTNGFFSAIVEALGIAALGFEENSSELVNYARTRYGLALKKTQVALNDPNLALSNEVLMTVLSLAQFEMVVSEFASPARSLTTHLKGASLLLRLRTPEWYNDAIARKIFRRLHKRIVGLSLSNSTTVPSHITNMSIHCKSHETYHELIECQLLQRLTDLCQVQHRVAQRDSDHNKAILRTLDKLNEELLVWSASLPPQYGFQTIRATSLDQAYSKHRHMYTSVWVAAVWNTYRTALSQIHNLMLQLVEYSDEGFQRRSLVSKEVLEIVGHDLCASTPFLLQATECSQPDSARGGVSFVNAQSAFWVLGNISRSARLPEDMRRWAAHQLERIASVNMCHGISYMSHEEEAGVHAGASLEGNLNGRPSSEGSIRGSTLQPPNLNDKLSWGESTIFWKSFLG